jgi:antitoxin VapB
VAADWGWLQREPGAVDGDFAGAASEQPAAQENPDLDFFA